MEFLSCASSSAALARCFITIPYLCFGQYDGAGRLVRYGAFSPASLLRTVRALVGIHGWPLPAALQLVTRNPAHFLGLPAAGEPTGVS